MDWVYIRRAICCTAAMFCVAPSAIQAQTLVAAEDQVEAPLLPTGISIDNVELFGRLAYVWDDARTKAHVIQYIGDFSLHLGRRRLRSQDAVIWMYPREYEGRKYQRFDIFLWRDVQVREPGGTLTTGPVLLVTLNSFGKVTVDADKMTRTSSADTPLYQEASRVHRELLAQEQEEVGGEPVRVITPTRDEPPPKVDRSPIFVRPGKEFISDVVNGKQIATAIGGIYISQGAIDSADFMEIRAKAAVLYMRPEAMRNNVDLIGQDKNEPSTPGKTKEIPLDQADRQDEVEKEQGMQTGFGDALEGVYMEGDVVLTRGERVIRAERLYYDFENNRAMILDTVMFAPQTLRGVPIYVRAEQVRQLSSKEYQATNAKVTTSEFYTPHYHIGAEKVYLMDRTSTDQQVVGLEAGSYKMYNTTFNINNVPLLYWPFTQGDFEQSEASFKRVSAGYSKHFGATLETKWQLLNVLGLNTPTGFDPALVLDYFSERGPAVGINLDYVRDDYFGLFRSYFINDTGNDYLGGIRNNLVPDTENRGRVLWRHRQFLPENWELSLELSYISDPNFLEEYFESEFDKGKDQETVIYLKKQEDNWAFTSLFNWRLLDYVTQTEHFPDFGFHLIGEPLGNVATLYSESHAGLARFRGDDRRFFDEFRFDNRANSNTIARFDTREEIDAPITLGPLKLMPFITQRASAWSNSPRDGGVTRYFGQYGVRSNMYFSKTDAAIQSRLFDINGIRHILKPEVIAWLSHNTTQPDKVHPFDSGIESINDFDGATLGLRQRWQTKRGGPGRWRNVDWVTLDLEMGAFNDSPSEQITNGDVFTSRPENSIAQNFVNMDFMYRISDETAILSDANWDMNDRELDVYNLAIAVERTPRLSYFTGYRYINETDSNLLGFGANYKMTKKHTVAVREFFDIERGETERFDIAYIRKFPRWYVSLNFKLDEIKDDVGVSISAWPEGLPGASVGSKRFTGLATSTGIKPD